MKIDPTDRLVLVVHDRPEEDDELVQAFAEYLVAAWMERQAQEGVAA